MPNFESSKYQFWWKLVSWNDQNVDFSYFLLAIHEKFPFTTKWTHSTLAVNENDIAYAE